MTAIEHGTEYLDDQEYRIWEAVGKLSRTRTANTSQVARRVGISATTASRVLHHLKARGFIKDVSRNTAYHWRQTGQPAHRWRDRNSLTEFMRRADPDGSRVTADIEVQRDADGNSPFVVVRYGKFTAVLALMPFDDKGEFAGHLCIDVHPFVDEQDATAAVFGMSNGCKWWLQTTSGTTSHGAPSAHGISVLIGEQGTV